MDIGIQCHLRLYFLLSLCLEGMSDTYGKYTLIVIANS